jgi:hypothetical protein
MREDTAKRLARNNAAKQRVSRERKEFSSNDQKIVADWMSGIEKRKPVGWDRRRNVS